MARVRHRECDVFTEPLQRGRHPTHALQSKRRQHIVFQIDTHLAFAAVCISGFLALPLPVACRLSFARLTADQGSPANSQARTATPHLGKRALTLDN